MNLRQLPNAITWLRVASVLPLTWSIHRGAYAEALGVAAFAAFTDALDGFVAKRCGWQSRFGSLLDPIADKLLLAGCFVALWSVEAVPSWLLVLVLGRDAVIVAGAFAYHFLIGPVEGQPTRISKLTTVLQIVLALALLVRLAGGPVAATWIDAGMWVVALATFASGLDYVLRWSARAMRQGRRKT